MDGLRSICHMNMHNGYHYVDHTCMLVVTLQILRVTSVYPPETNFCLLRFISVHVSSLS